MIGGYIDNRSSGLKTMAELFQIRAAVQSASDIEEIRTHARIKDQEVSIMLRCSNNFILICIQITALLSEMQKSESQRHRLRELITARKDELNNMNSEMAIIVKEIKSKKQALQTYEISVSELTSALEVLCHMILLLLS
jgi:hypothetical protein